MNMREKIARAIDDADRHSAGFVERAADAVLGALWEPDELMVQAGNDARDPNAPIGPNTVEVWQAMLSAAGGGE